MAFPTIPTTGNGRLLSQNQNNTTAARTFPSLTGLTKNAGDLLVAICVSYERSAASATFGSWGGGFNELADIDGGATTMAVGIATKTSTGSETGTFTVTQAATVTGHCSLFLLSIPGWLAISPAELTALAVGTTAAADPGALNPSGWGTTDTLWIAVGGNGETNTGGSWTGLGTPTAPTNYTSANSPGIGTDAVGGIHAAVAFRQNATASEDVGTWGGQDVSNARNCALLIAVRGIVTITPSITTGTESDAAQALSYNASFYDITTTTETDLAGDIIAFQPLPALETDSAQTLTRSTPILKTLTLAAETDSAQALAFAQASDFDLTLAAETDAAQPVAFAQASDFDLTLAAETDAAVALVAGQVSDYDITLTAETDAAQALSQASGVTITTALEFDNANTIVALVVLPASEADSAQPVTFDMASGQDFDLTLASETDSAQAQNVDKTVTATTTTETDTAIAAVHVKQLVVVTASETDSAQAVSYSQAGSFSIATATETDAATTLTIQGGTYDLTLASEVDVAGDIVALQTLPASESDSAQALTFTQDAVSITQATETDSAQALTAAKAVTLPEYEQTPPLPYNTITIGDTSTAIALVFESGAATYSITVATETDSPQTLTKTKTFTRAAETDAALTLTYSQAGAYSIAPALEVAAAQTLSVTKPILKSVTVATETDSAQTITYSQAGSYSITFAGETDSAQAVTFTKTIVKTLTLASETDEAQVIPYGGIFVFTEATETNTAVALRYAAMPPSGTLGAALVGRIRQTRTGRVNRSKQGVLR